MSFSSNPPESERQKRIPTLRRRLAGSLLDGVPSLQPGGKIQNPPFTKSLQMLACDREGADHQHDDGVNDLKLAKDIFR